MKKIVILDGTKRASLAICRSLGMHKDNFIIVGSNNKLGLTLYSKYCKGRFVYRDEYILEDLKIFLSKNHVDYIIPQFDSTIEVLSLNKQFIEKEFNCKVGIVDDTILSKISNKDILLEIAEKNDIKVPKQLRVEKIEDLDKFDFDYPVVVKPTKSILKNLEGKVRFIFDFEELKSESKKYLDNNFILLIQECILGVGIGYFCLMNEKQEVLAEFSHQRIRELDINGGPSVYCKSIEIDYKLREQSLRLLRALKWEGPCMVEYKKDKRGIFYLMEINGRFWGSLQLAILSGVDFPKIYLNNLLGKEKIKAIKVRKDVKVRWFVGDFYNLLQKLKRKKTIHGRRYSKIKALKEFISCEVDGYMVFDLKDLKPFFVQILQIIVMGVLKWNRKS